MLLDYLRLPREVLNGLVHLEFGVSVVLFEHLFLLLGSPVKLVLILFIHLGMLHFKLLISVDWLVAPTALFLFGSWVRLRGLGWLMFLLLLLLCKLRS